MRILLLAHAFNSLTQRLFVELAADGHELSVELDIQDRVSLEAVAAFGPDVIVAPFLKRALPASIWERQPCFIVHPGPPGDRGPAALDWAVLRALPTWGVTVLQAQAELDAGPVWAYADFPMRSARKSSVYRNEVTDAAVHAVRAALARHQSGLGPLPATQLQSGASGAPHGWQAPLTAAQRAIDWSRDDTATVLRKIHAADGFPGVEHALLGRRYRLFDARAAAELAPTPALRGPRAAPGTLLGRGDAGSDEAAICIATRDGGVWIGQLRPLDTAAAAFKLPAMTALGAAAQALPALACDPDAAGDIRYEECGPVGYLAFDFYNGALGTAQCARLRAAYALARARPTRVIVLLGGQDFWCNGLHLHAIEAAESAGAASWDNILAIDDLVLDILTTDTHLTIAAVHGNAAAGGVFLALAADHVLARTNVVFNPHYRNMGNLYGSEYWTYLLPGRAGEARAQEIVARRLPMGAAEALRVGLIDETAGPGEEAFLAQLARRALALADDAAHAAALVAKRARRARDEQARPLAQYREEELAQMRLNFFGFDPSYHVARHRFVHRTPAAWTPLHLARHRQLGYPPVGAPAGA